MNDTKISIYRRKSNARELNYCMCNKLMNLNERDNKYSVQIFLIYSLILNFVIFFSIFPFYVPNVSFLNKIYKLLAIEIKLLIIFID